MKNVLYIQSGGPTTVINATAYGVIQACLANSGSVGRLFAAEHGILGVIHDRLFDVLAEAPDELELLKQTPSSIFGSCRYRIANGEAGEADYASIVQTCDRNNIGHILYNGGNGTLRACRDLAAYLKRVGHSCRVVAIPKTVDNDIHGLDHAPGFPSAARHVAITVSELAHDIRVYDTGLIMVLEVMGRNTGWLAATTLLCAKHGDGPNLIYTPEHVFEDDRFIRDVENAYARRNKVLAVVAEGVRKSDGTYLFEYGSEVFEGKPHKNMGGITPYLVDLLRRHFSCKIRGIDLGLMQRCGMHTASQVDIDEAVRLGEEAVLAALDGQTEIMVAVERLSSRPYRTAIRRVPLAESAGRDGVMPMSYITPEKNYINDSFLDYIEPLVGELPRYAKLRLGAGVY
ncbi:MAG: diphosphate--fructose-6-phosphate 1-phosphotransferase [Planctomycetes bacterium]|nr:diphosphate--fructose-6-phosphate 1-phosphotransferase [Planctomycetota bacterium]